MGDERRNNRMLQTQQIEELICLVSALDREALMRQFVSYQATFPVDFTPEFLATTPLERLRHIFLAMCLQSQRFPEAASCHAA
jgi:hypothetical protein